MVTTITPAGPPPPGQVSNFIDPPYDGTRFLIVNVIFMPLAVIAVLIRLWTRFAVTRAGGLDDYLMVLAVLSSAVLSGLTITMLHYGLAKHMWDVPLTQFSPRFLLLNLMSATIYFWTIIAVAAGYNIASIFVNLFSCNPIPKSWDASILHGNCIDRPTFYFANAGLGIATDFATLLAPVLQLPLRQKLMVAGILVMGGFVCIVSIIRLTTLSALQKTTDLTYATTNALLWCVIELNLGIIGGSFPALRPFFRQYFPGFLGGTTGRSRGQSYGYAQASNSRFRHSHKLGSFPSSPGATSHDAQFSQHNHIYSSNVAVGQSENDSEEHIMYPPQPNPPGHIVKTVEYSLRTG
ncbi:hypothetical protein FQN55_005018 [Onygenales sp. PD_40]|nr:hypothetical protein FQN55_005018 [Onygenales sp. PD_40]KAK2788784.1 hypothetical protein FQN52_006540 [Onygenales sp. PD_12]